MKRAFWFAAGMAVGSACWLSVGVYRVLRGTVRGSASSQNSVENVPETVVAVLQNTNGVKRHVSS